MPTLSRTMNFYQWPLEEMRATSQKLIAQALQKRYQRRGPIIYLILDDTVLPKQGKKLPKLGHHFAPSQDRVVRGHDLVFAAVRLGSFTAPCDWRCYVNKCFCKEEDFHKRTELAVELGAVQDAQGASKKARADPQRLIKDCLRVKEIIKELKGEGSKELERLHFRYLWARPPKKGEQATIWYRMRLMTLRLLEECRGWCCIKGRSWPSFWMGRTM